MGEAEAEAEEVEDCWLVEVVVANLQKPWFDRARPQELVVAVGHNRLGLWPKIHQYDPNGRTRATYNTACTLDSLHMRRKDQPLHNRRHKG